MKLSPQRVFHSSPEREPSVTEEGLAESRGNGGVKSSLLPATQVEPGEPLSLSGRPVGRREEHHPSADRLRDEGSIVLPPSRDLAEAGRTALPPCGEPPGATKAGKSKGKATLPPFRDLAEGGRTALPPSGNPPRAMNAGRSRGKTTLPPSLSTRTEGGGRSPLPPSLGRREGRPPSQDRDRGRPGEFQGRFASDLASFPVRHELSLLPPLPSPSISSEDVAPRLAEDVAPRLAEDVAPRLAEDVAPRSVHQSIRILRDPWQGRSDRHPPEALARESRACSLVKPVREPDAGDPHVRFDERRWETEPWPRLRHRHSAKAAGNSYSLDLQPPRPPPTLPQFS
jgi:hypothetical protein